uniref:Tyrosine-protein kinase n=1 Tax=Gasterosteus aculeatus aculeatus TaxID=481459 RepID=A0AAQ4REE7_GASAC
MDLREEESAPLVIRDWGGSQRLRSTNGPNLQVHLYFLPSTKNETTIHISSGQISAENVCIQACKKCGILPVYQSVFGLASTDLSFWYPPSHMFNTEEDVQVHFRVRFFFGNWFGQGPGTSYRYSLTRDRISPVFDCSVIDYLFSQLRSDFIACEAGVCPPLSAQEECLGLAVLDLWRMAKERHQSVKELCMTVSYKSCLPMSHREDIQRRNRLDRYRIRNTLKRFLKKLGSCSIDECSLKLKYLIELAGIVPSLGSETFQVNPSSSQSQSTFSLVKVTWERGIETSGSLHPDEELWHTFSDFKEIIDIGIKRVCHEQVPQDSRVVTITRKDDRCLEANFQSLKEALSFVSLVDGYFRLSTDSNHYFCQNIAPPSVLEGIKNHCHGPITSEFAVSKLKKSGFKGGTFLLRQSPKNYDNFFLTTPLGLDYKDCLIIKNERYSLPGVQKSFSSLKELTGYYQQNKLLLADVPVKLLRCCPPQHKGTKQTHLEIFFFLLSQSFFEAASVMSQISHSHLLLVYGVSVHGVQNIMVQEFVEYGALDLYLKRRRSLSMSWKLDVAKQLASALLFLEEKNIVHGNICAKNLLLAREDDPSQGISPFIKLSDPGISVAMLGKEVTLDRIPWVAPELLDSPENLTLGCDKWSFGATVWEIFNNGNTPLLGWELEKKEQFYKSFQQLPPSQWTELADLVSQCMDYQAVFRPSCRCIIRQLNSLITSDYVILHATEPIAKSSVRRTSIPAQPEQTVFEERHLRFISSLGKGNFGSVELCRYDPLGDNTGELVAVKKLQPNEKSTLEDFKKEVKILSIFECEYIVKYKGICYSTGRLSMSLVMEYLPHGNLIGYLNTYQHINTRRMLLFASQICKGMEYLQSLRYVHRDLAARNILVASESLVKIADFGLTKVIPFDKDYYRVMQPGESPIFWYAPESINESRFSHKSDVWSFGVVLHELFSYCNTNYNPKRVGGLTLIHRCMDNSNWRLPAPSNCPPEVRCPCHFPAFTYPYTNILYTYDNFLEERDNLKG